MKDKMKKTILLNSLVFLFCIIIIALYCITLPKRESIAKLQTYEVTFETDGGSSIPSISVEEGHAIEAPDMPTRDGYIFDGWILDGDLYDFSNGVNGNIVLKAKWKEVAPDTVIYLVTFDTDGGSSIPDQNIVEGELVNMPPDPSKDGYKFLEWQLNGLTYDFNAPVYGNITLFALWQQEDEPEPEDDTTYTVKFDLNGGSGSNPPDQEVKKGRRASAPSAPTRSGYVFVGWNTNRNASSGNINSVTIRSNTTFYAIWREITPDVKTYTVTIVLGSDASASSCNTTQTVVEGGSPSGCTNPVKAHHQFGGWTDGSSTKGSISDFTITRNTTITARWTEDPKYEYVLNYDTSGGTSCNPTKDTSYETSFSLRINCNTKSNNPLYELGSWTLNGNTVSGSVPLNSNNSEVTIKANYTKPVQFTITCIEGNNGYAGSGTCSSLSYSPSITGGYIGDFEGYAIPAGINVNITGLTPDKVKVCYGDKNCSEHVNYKIVYYQG